MMLVCVTAKLEALDHVFHVKPHLLDTDKQLQIFKSVITKFSLSLSHTHTHTNALAHSNIQTQTCTNPYTLLSSANIYSHTYTHIQVQAQTFHLSSTKLKKETRNTRSQ